MAGGQQHTSASLVKRLLFYNRIETLELDARISGGELPVHLDAPAVASFFPGSDLLDERILVSKALIQALPGQD